MCRYEGDGSGEGSQKKSLAKQILLTDSFSLSALATPPYTHLENGLGRRGMAEEPADGDCWRGSGCCG